jgi:hypothetical protein
MGTWTTQESGVWAATLGHLFMKQGQRAKRAAMKTIEERDELFASRGMHCQLNAVSTASVPLLLAKCVFVAI